MIDASNKPKKAVKSNLDEVEAVIMLMKKYKVMSFTHNGTTVHFSSYSLIETSESFDVKKEDLTEEQKEAIQRKQFEEDNYGSAS